MSRESHRKSRAAVRLGVLLLSLGLVALTLNGPPAQATSSIAKKRCFGAAALDRPRCAPTRSGPVAQPKYGADDRSRAYDLQPDGKDCWSHTPAFPQRRCSFGHPKGRYRVALLGNSHAGEWLPTLQVLAARHRWRIKTYIASGCASADLRQDFGGVADANCRQWAQKAVAGIAASKADLVVMSNRLSRAVPGKSIAASRTPYKAGYQRLIRKLLRAGKRVLVVRDTPAPGDSNINGPQCLARNPKDYRPCSGTPDSWLPADPAMWAAWTFKSKKVRTADLTGHMCYPTRCWAAIGGVSVYFDGSHMTATYARTLAPYLEPKLLRLGGRKAR